MRCVCGGVGGGVKGVGKRYQGGGGGGENKRVCDMYN